MFIWTIKIFNKFCTLTSLSENPYIIYIVFYRVELKNKKKGVIRKK